ncbi:hypothetical protein UACE39S_00977 [Ureibacillus acetophenoni]
MITEKYKDIAPTISYLGDKLILVQAWKKSHTYIRKHNWYADILELDCSIIDLEERIKEWSLLLTEQPYKPDPLRVVWAPKSQKWHFPQGSKKLWYPIDRNGKRDKQALRPLAHLSIRDQTIATSVMLCLADAIETAQGPTDETDFLKAQREGIYSYGNRLQCEWITHLNKGRQAKFSWGSSKCYRQYYDDYKCFLKRPKEICNYYSTSLSPNKELYIISLDLSKFYNNIDLNSLLDELKFLYEDYYTIYNPFQAYEEDSEFWEKVQEVFDWEWSDKDYDANNTILQNAKSQLGLPQGLVASGFFANAYLIRFDRMIGNYLKVKQKKDDEINIGSMKLKILDYCRYVDDIRLVVEVSKKESIDDIKQNISEFMESKIEEHLKVLKSKDSMKIKINANKTSIISYHQLSNESNISTVMSSIQSRISGTPDLETLHQVIGELGSLLKMSDIIQEKEKQKGNPLELSRIFLPHLDVRDDTLKRFAATRLVRTLRDKKSMTVHSEKVAVNEFDGNEITASNLIEHEFETAARNLISLWSQDISLSLLLKCGFDLYPDVKLLYPVLEALELKLFTSEKGEKVITEVKSAEYVISDLFKGASIYIGYRDENAYPNNLNLQAFHEELAALAKKILTGKKQFPWYVKQQAILFLITNKDFGITISEDESELKLYKLLLESILYKVSNKDYKNRLATSLVAQQLNPNKQKYVMWFINFMDQLISDESKKSAIKTVAMSRDDLLQEILKSDKIRGLKWSNLIPTRIKNHFYINNYSEFDLNTKESIPLLTIIQSRKNPFIQENALLLLTKAILDNSDSKEHLNKGRGILDLKVRCDDWLKIQNPDFKGFRVIWDIQENDDTTSLINNKDWVDEKFLWMYSLGMILRSCITGEFDFTTHSFVYTADEGKYKGIKSTSFTRQFSIINSSIGLVRDYGPVTPWLSELLYKLLQWPGIIQWEGNIQNWRDISNLSDLQKIINNRLKHQSEIYGKLSQTPVYKIPISKSLNSNNSKLRFAVVQPLLPQSNDFNTKDPTNWSEAFRNKHRDHLASICHLITKQVDSTIRARKDLEKYEKSNDSFEGVDVIVFPELSVHPDDIYILRSLSDKTKAHIFAGLTFIQPSTFTNPINQALWLLRSEHKSGREFISVYQGKQHMTNSEKKMGIQPHRPYQIVVELDRSGENPICLAGAICYDATDLSIAADLRDVSDVFIISAMNKDIQTFDNMVGYLHYHMYQPIILANSGEYGGSTVQAPFTKHQRTIAHVHGNQQIAISIFEIDPSIFKLKTKPSPLPDIKTPPAGYKGR